MARNRTIPPEFWTCEAVIDCKPMTRLLFLGLWNFADDHGVQPLRPRTIRLQVLPGDALDNEDVRAMIEELAARKLVRIYQVDGVEYLAVVDWEQYQRVGKNARRRYPPFPVPVENQDNSPAVSGMEEGPSASPATAIDDESPRSPTSDPRPPSPHPHGEREAQFTDPEPLSQAA